MDLFQGAPEAMTEGDMKRCSRPMPRGLWVALFLASFSLPALSAMAGEAVRLAPAGKQPRLAVTREGLVAAVYGEGSRILCRVSKDGGASFGLATRVAEVDKLLLGMRRGPQVAAAESSLVVTAIGGAGDLLSWTSADEGRTWTGPTKVNDSPTSAREGLHGLAGGVAGAVHVVWLDLRDGPTKVFGARSADGGKTWGPNHAVYESPEKTVCECCQPTVAADDSGGVAVMWRNLLAGSRDMFLARSSDGGRTFSGGQKLGTGTWPLEACPMDGGGVALSGGDVATVWRREDVVYAASPGKEEEPLGKGRNAVVAFGPRGVMRAWQGAGGDIVLAAAGSPPVSVGRGRFPAFGAMPGGGGPLLLAWEDPESGAMIRPVEARSPR